MDWQSIAVGAVSGGLLAGAAQLLAAKAGLRKSGADVAKSYQEIAAKEAEENKRKDAEIETLEEALRDSAETTEKREQEMRRCRSELMALKVELGTWKRLFPAHLWPHLQAITADLTHVLDLAGAFTITEPLAGGTFRWVSIAFAAGLGMTREEFLACDWQSRVHPADKERTFAAESAAQGQRIRFTNRFLHGDGHTYVWVRWTSTQYLAGISFSWVEFLDVPAEDAGK